MITVEICCDADGAPESAGGGAIAEPDGSEFSVIFTIENLDSLGTMTSFHLSGFPSDPGPLGTDICPLAEPLVPLASAVCVVGPFPVLDGSQEFLLAANGTGHRQGEPFQLSFSPPIPEEPSFANAPHSFTFVFDVPSDPDGGFRIGGTTGADAVDVSLDGLVLSLPLRVDCSDGFPGGFSGVGGSPTAGEPRIMAYVIGNYDANGGFLDSCSLVPKQDVTFTAAAASHGSVNYEGPSP